MGTISLRSSKGWTPALLIRMSGDPICSAAVRICAGSLTSRVTGVTRSSAYASGWRVAGVHLLGAPAEGFGDECLPDAAVGAGHQDGLPAMFMSVPPGA
jgi:hypothetical protein